MAPYVPPPPKPTPIPVVEFNVLPELEPVKEEEAVTVVEPVVEPTVEPEP